MISYDDSDIVVSSQRGSDVEEVGQELESENDSLGDTDDDEVEESGVVEEQHDDTDDETPEGVNKDDDVIGDDNDDNHSEVVDEVDDAHEEGSYPDEEFSNDLYDSAAEDDDIEVDGNTGGIQEIESDSSDDDLVEEQEEPNLEDSGHECNDGAHDKSLLVTSVTAALR